MRNSYSLSQKSFLTLHHMMFEVSRFKDLPWRLDSLKHSFSWKMEKGLAISSFLRTGKEGSCSFLQPGRGGGNPGSGGFQTEDEGVSLCFNSQDSIPAAGGPEFWTKSMEGSVLSPTSWEKRRAWLRQSRHWQTQVLEEEAAAALQDVPDAEPSSLDDVFQGGKRQTPTLSCRENMAASPGLWRVDTDPFVWAKPPGRLILTCLSKFKGRRIKWYKIMTYIRRRQAWD